MQLGREFFTQDAYLLAQTLLGKILCICVDENIKKFRIVETEAYGGAYDRACHAYNFRRTKRTEALYLPGGHVYIYLIYGMYYMLNITASIKDTPEAVLIRAVEPLYFNDKKITTNGPGKLCKQLGIDKSFNTLDLVSSDLLYLEEDSHKIFEIVTTKRINIDYALEDKNRLWRFYIKGNNHVSKK